MLHAALVAAFLPCLVQQPAVTLAEEQAAPFCWFLVPSDVIGFKDCPEGVQVTYDGAFNTGFGELDLSVGLPLKPVDQRVKTLYKGYLPIVQYGFTRDGVSFQVQAYGAPKGLDPTENLVCYIRVTVKNPGQKTVRTLLNAIDIAPFQ